MDEQKKQFLEQHYAASEWREQVTRGMIKDLTLNGSELPGWTQVRAQWDEIAAPPSYRSIWRHGDETEELLSVRIVECNTETDAHDQMIEELGNFEAMAIERRSGAEAIGDVAFGFGETMVLFARANLVVVASNAGPKVVSVVTIAQEIDALVRRRLG